ncbi:serine hydrolase domain-containing protein [Phycicoccus jejuensis]|uniref:serine hydrolase domain-containing protein n=1 Tax=Phycicoccus jejuensis TaxID=367299 RepID=UPI0004C2F751|nr:serine hydrolase domain-containing protein [Phycicoccus jejuensis]
MSSPADTAQHLLTLGERHPAGAVVGWRTPDGGCDVAASGWADLGSADAEGTPMTPDCRLDLASVTKVAVTTTLALLLTAEQLLDVDAPVGEYLPDAADARLREDATVADLLSHSAGLPPWRPLYLAGTDREGTLERVLALPLHRPPGHECRYSDLGMVLAGLVVERACGEDLDVAFRSRVAEPLGLAARFGPVAAAQAATSSDSDVVEQVMVATGRPYPVDGDGADFRGWRAGPVRGRANDGNAAHALGGVAGHAGLFAPLADLLLLGAALTDGRLVDTTLLDRFTRPTAVDPSQALGFRVHDRADGRGGPGRWLWHSGFTGTFWAFDPATGVVVAAAATRLHGTTGPLLAVPPAPETPDPLAGLATGDEIAAAVLAAAPRGEETTR